MGGGSSQTQKIDIVVLGSSYTGKTTLLYQLTQNKTEPEPTKGFFYEMFDYKELRFRALEIGGKHKNSFKWFKMLKKCKAIIYVIDSTDTRLLDFAREKLFQHLENEAAKKLPLLIYANKQDLPHPMTTDEIIEKFQLDTIKNQVWHVQESSFTTGDGIYEGIDWIIEHIPKN